MMYSLNGSIIFLEKILSANNHYSIQKDHYVFNNSEYKDLAQQVVNNTFELTSEAYIKDEVFSEMFKTYFEINQEKSFINILDIFIKYQRTYFTIYFYTEEQKDYFLLKSSEHIVDNLININDFRTHLYKIDEELEYIYKEHKQYKLNATLPENIPDSFNNLIDMYHFFEINMDLEHLNREKNITRDSLLNVIIENEEKNIYYSKESFKHTQHILNSAIKSNDIFIIDQILHSWNIKLNAFLLTQENYYQFSFINLIKQFRINNSTENYELKVYKVMLEILVNLYFEMYNKDHSSNKHDKLHLLLTFIINWNHELQDYLLSLLYVKLQKTDIDNFVKISLEKSNISLIYFLFTVYEGIQTKEKQILEEVSSKIVNTFIKSYDNPFELHSYKKFNFKLLFKYTSVDTLLAFCKDLNNIKNDSNKYKLKNYLEVLFNLYTKEMEIEIVNIVLNLTKTDYGLNLGLINEDEFIALLNLFEINNFEIILKEINNIDDLLKIYNIILDKAKKSIVSKKLEDIEISYVNKNSAFLAQELGFYELSTRILKMFNDDETSKFVKCKVELSSIYKDNILTIKEKHEKLNNFKINVINHFNKQYCQYYLSFLHTILNIDRDPKYVYDSLKNLFNNSPQHLYFINIAIAYIELVKDDEDKKDKLKYLIKELKILLEKLDNKLVLKEYEIFLFLYNETDNYIEFEKLWQSMQIVDTIDLNIVKIRVDFLIKKLQSTEAIDFLNDIQNYYFDLDTINEIKDLKIDIKNGAKEKLETIGMRFEEIIKEDIMYDVALSFAGEQREYVEKVAKALKEKKINVFYDEYEQADLWGKDLYVHLDEVYSKKSKFVIMFISKEYAEKLWTTHEKKSAQARAFKEKEEYILPVKFDETEIPGIRDTVGYLDANKFNPDELVDMFIKKFFNE